MQMRIRNIIVVSSLAAVSACAGNSDVATPASTSATTPVAPTATATGTTRDALDHMARGEAELASQILNGLLQNDPDNRMARRLLDQIDTDPRTLLGDENYTYRIRPGDSLSSIAQARLGDGTLFYALARYNGIADPRRIVAGQSILIPGTPITESRPVDESRPAASEPPTSRTPARNPARARSLRAQGLEAMNRGAIDRAINLLSRAARLDPENAAIRSDLARARRVRRAVSR